MNRYIKLYIYIGVIGVTERQVKKMDNEIMIDQLQEQIDELKDDVKHLEKMNEVLSGKLLTIIKSIDSLSSRVDDCESDLCNGHGGY